MLVHVDIRGLEVVTAAYLSQDPVLCDEIRSGFDFHADNQTRFNLVDRTTAKRFVFQLLYGGTAFGYTQKPDFFHVSRKQQFWQDVIDKFYQKYSVLAKWHQSLMQEVMKNGYLVMPTGREYHFTPMVFKGEHKWPRTKILNYPVQGTGADLVCIGRVTLWKRLKKTKFPILFQSTVHDSIDLDVLDNDLEMIYNVCKIVKSSIEDIPLNFYRLFGKEFNLPVSSEIKFGHSLGALQLYDN